jgi:hypothetical protein
MGAAAAATQDPNLWLELDELQVDVPRDGDRDRDTDSRGRCAAVRAAGGSPARPSE